MPPAPLYRRTLRRYTNPILSNCIERHPYTKSRIDQILCVCVCMYVCMYACMYVCMCNYSSQATEPSCIKKLYQQIERLTQIAIGYLDLKYLPPPYLKPPKNPFLGAP